MPILLISTATFAFAFKTSAAMCAKTNCSANGFEAITIKDAKESGVFRDGNKVTVRIASQAPAYSLREFELKVGDEVTLILTNLDKVEDLSHGFAIPKYDINFVVNPLETKSVTFKADKPGVFWCYCTHFCHALHLEMRTRMLVRP